MSLSPSPSSHPSTVTDETFGDSPKSSRRKPASKSRYHCSQLAQDLYRYGLQCLSGETVAPRDEILLGQQDLSNLLGVSHSAVSQWITARKIVPCRKNPASDGAMFRLHDVLIIARNAIRAGLAKDLLQMPLHGFKPGMVCMPPSAAVPIQGYV